MNNFFGIVEAFYQRFILRDLLAKVSPGAFLLLSVFFISNNFKFTLELIQPNILLVILFLTFAWIVGFAIQGIGERFKLIQYHIDNEAADNYTKILFNSNLENFKDIERMVVIKELCGNSYVSMLVVSIFYIINETIKFLKVGYLNINLMYLPRIILFIILIFALRYMHFQHVSRQNTMVLKAIESKKI